MADENASLTRDQIARSLATKDPAWFRQTADRGLNSPAYRKTQVEDSNVVDHGRSSPRVHMPGMAREGKSTYAIPTTDPDRASSPSRDSSTNDSVGQSSYSTSTTISSSIGSPLPQSSAQRFEPPGPSANSTALATSSEEGRIMAMSPSQGRISPERLERPSSPTKGMGGFVQSAMMKRSDSVNKRWSVQSPTGLNRGNSVASNRSSVYDPTMASGIGGLMSPPGHRSTLSRDSSPLPTSRPTSSHSYTTATQDLERSNRSSPTKTATTKSTANTSFAKPSLPASTSQSSMTSQDEKDEVLIEATPPSSPSKASGRWSPTKSSWLESALNKPDSPKPKPAPAMPQQPAWMAEINKAKARGPDEPKSTALRTKHEVNIGGLLRSPPMGGTTKPISIGGLPAGFSAGSVAKPRMNSISSIASGDFSKQSTNPTQRPTSSSSSSRPSTPLTGTGGKPKSPAVGKVKPDTPPKKDFRSNLKPRQPPPESKDRSEPEFKNVIGQLRRTKTQNYVAPDILKENIARGKADLNLTGGPKRGEVKDEFKDAILKKKEDFKKAQEEGVGVIRSVSGSKQSSAQLPEGLLKASQLGRSATIPVKPLPLKNAESTKKEESTPTRTSVKPSLIQEMSAPGRLQSIERGSSSLAARFNPALAGILARGPPISGADVSRSANPVSVSRDSNAETSSTVAENGEEGPQLTHITKARARGPKRKAPSVAAKSASTAAEAVKIVETMASPPFENGSVPAVSEVLSKTRLDDASQPLSESNPLPREEPKSPRKLDLKRRSQFLAEDQEGKEKAPKPLDISGPSSPVKSHASENTTKDSASTSTKAFASVPTSKPKLYYSNPSPTLIKRSDFETPSPETARKLTPAPLSPSKAAIEDSESLQSQFAVREKEVSHDKAEPASLFKNAASLFGRSSPAPEKHTVKEPIKLPTKADEQAATASAGLPGQPISKPVSPTISKPSKPLPLLSPKPATSFSSSASDKLATPRVASKSSTPASTSTSQLLTDFFGINDTKPTYEVDTASVLLTKPEAASKIKSLRSQLFQLMDSGKKQLVPNHQERILFENNMYICPHTFGTLSGKKVTEVYFWIGDGVSESSIEDATIFAQREAKSSGGVLVKIRQGKETFEFIEALGGIAVIRRGSSNKYDSLSPHILCGRRHQGQIVFDEVDFKTGSLCSGFPYLIATSSGQQFLWKGKGSSVDELSCARLLGMDFGITGEIIEVDEGSESQEFLKFFGNEAKIMKSADHWRLKPNYEKYCARLFRANDDNVGSPQFSNKPSFFRRQSGPDVFSQITEVSPFTQHDISPSHIYVLDAFFEIYIIVGSGSQTQYNAFCTALLFAQEYGILAAGMEDRPFVPVSTVVLEGVPRDLKFVFRKWEDTKNPTTVHSPMTTLSRGRSLRVVTLNAALDATTQR